MEAISVQQRHANKDLAKKAANQKSAQRMPYTQEKALRRRAMRTAQQLSEADVVCIIASQLQVTLNFIYHVHIHHLCIH